MLSFILFIFSASDLLFQHVFDIVKLTHTTTSR